MITAESVKAKIRGLISKANATTGKNDTDLSSGVDSLIEGYGTGDIEAYDGSVTVDDGATVVFDEDYAEGKADGIAEGIAEGIEQGKKVEYDGFWDVYQENGSRDNYLRAFVGYGFSFDNFYPKYDIRPITSAEYLFYAWENALPNQTGSLTERLKECGVVLDTSLCTTLGYMFAYAFFTELPTLDFSGVTKTGTNVFRAMTYLKKIEKLIVNENLTYSQWFQADKQLSEVVIEGIIGNDISFADCPLSKASTTSVMTALSSTTTGKTATFKKSAVDTAFETSEGLADGSSSAEWATLVETKSNWTVSLV